jgi:outer membrane protein assembly factor BamB
MRRSRPFPYNVRHSPILLDLTVRPLVLLAALLPTTILAAEPIEYGPSDWPWWRGPNRDGVAEPKQKPPIKWSETENVLWKIAIPGRGHGAAIVIGDQVFIATAEIDRQLQSVLCLDRRTGKQLWRGDVHTEGVQAEQKSKGSLASITPACDGKRLLVNFVNSGAVYATALNRRDGSKLWQTKVADYVMHQGYGSSPAVYQDLVLVAADHKGGGALAGLERATGKIVWKIDRPKLPNYASPIILNIGGKDQLLFTGCKLVTSLEPLTGKTIWETPGSTEECVTSIITDGERVFTSGGYPKNHVAAIRADGSGKVAWENGTRVYVPSLVIHDKHLYGVQDGGMATCWDSETGKQVWSERLGGAFTASPVLVGERIYATDETGKTYIFAASKKGLEVEATNQLGTEALATSTICGSRIYPRVAVVGKDKKRQEWLYCLGKE